MFYHDTVNVLRKVYSSMNVDVTDVDLDKYNLTKKFSEVRLPDSSYCILPAE